MPHPLAPQSKLLYFILNAAGGGRMPCDHRPAAPPAASEPSEAFRWPGASPLRGRMEGERGAPHRDRESLRTRWDGVSGGELGLAFLRACGAPGPRTTERASEGGWHDGDRERNYSTGQVHSQAVVKPGWVASSVHSRNRRWRRAMVGGRAIEQRSRRPQNLTSPHRQSAESVRRSVEAGW